MFDGVGQQTETSSGAGILNRFKITAEVAVSKIFPGAFLWQYGSVVAGDLGFASNSAGFALATGLGDFTGVFLGHSLYYAIKSMFAKNISIGQEVQTGFFLGSAAFFSGSRNCVSVCLIMLTWPY